MFLPLCVRYGSNIRHQNLPPEDCWPGVKHVYMVSQPNSRGLFARVQLVYMVSEPTSRELFARAAACFPTYLKVTLVTVDLGCRLLMLFLILLTGECRSRVQPVYTVSKPTLRKLLIGDAASLYGF